MKKSLCVSENLVGILTIALLVFGVVACSDDPEVEGDVGLDASADDVDDDDVDDDDADVLSDADADEGPSARVEIDLEPYLEEIPDPGGAVQVYEATSVAELIEGPSATSRVGDFILENDLVRFAVQDDVRTMSPCSWGGNLIDGEYRSDDYGGDILGEICLLINADQTFKPELYEVIHGGSEGVAVLAISGRTTIFDYFNIEGMIYAMGGSFMADMFEMKPDDLLPLAITKYYVLRAGDPGVRVVTAIRNDGDEDLSLVLANLMVNGADGAYFNPLSSPGGFGFVDMGLANPDPDRIPFLAMLSENSSLAFAPRPADHLDADLPIAGSYLTIFNVAAAVLGQTDIVGTLLSSLEQIAAMEGAMHLGPGEVDSTEYWTFVGDGDLSTVVDSVYAELPISSARLEGLVVDGDEMPLVGARVSAIDDQGRTMNQAVTDETGAYSMIVPAESYELVARRDDHYTVTPQVADAGSGGTIAVDDLVAQITGFVDVTVTTSDGEPTPARVSIICQGDCPHKATSNEKDVTFHGLPDEFATIEWVGVDGELTFPVPEGSYRIVVSRGMEWSLWPSGAIDSGGISISVQAGQTTTVTAEIERVVDTSGALSGDFHVHAIASLDSITPTEDRINTFLTEGVDVVVSSDHDVIVDYAPAVESLGAQDHITTLVGTEITTIDLGHYNAFPIVRDEEDRQGGTLDWAGGEGLALTPAEIFEWMRDFPDEQVVQVNHPDSSYMAFSDVLRGISYGDVTRMRVRTPDYDPDTGDTGLWSDDFTAMELMNGPRMDRFWGVARWWLTMIGRGHTPAGTAVTDTHDRYGRVMGGVPRTFVFVDEGSDTVATFDRAHFVEAVNAGRAIGTNGPFVRVEATNEGGESASIGEVLETGGQPVTFELTIQVPEWVHVDSVAMVMNSEEVVTDAGEYNTDPIEATETFPVNLSADDLQVVATGTSEHRRYEKTVEIEVETDVDAYVVFFVRGSRGMYPILPDDEIEPFAFTNPIYLDVDGNGYSEPPLADLAATDPPDVDPDALMPGFHTDELKEMSRPERRQFFIEHLPHMDGGHSH